MRTLAGMTTAERTDYMNALAGLNRDVVPRDAQFLILLVRDDGAAHWVASERFAEIPAAMRAAADDVERMKRSN